MNEYKIQLESKEDLIYLKQEFVNFCSSHSGDHENFNLSDNLKQQFYDRVFGIISENVQVNGLDWSMVENQNSEIEGVKADLVQQLQDLQVETEELLQRTIEHRRQVPKDLKDLFIKDNSEVLKRIVEEKDVPVKLNPQDLELCSIDTTIKPNFYSNKLSSGLSHLVQLKDSIPEIVAKLERAQNVITEEGGKRLDENCQLLNRHRRLSRQFDLASKIGGF